jgi:3-deoxy-7-phosphoheptulonate synthase
MSLQTAESRPVPPASSLPGSAPLVAGPAARAERLPAAQQPPWDDPHLVDRIRDELLRQPPLVAPAEVRTLRTLLAQVAHGRMQLVQAGDCAEDPAECTSGHIVRKVGLLHALAGVMQLRTGRPVLRVGRIAGQFAKPRSAATEWLAGRQVPTFRGAMVNDPRPDPAARRPDPTRIRSCFEAARRALRHLNHPAPDLRVWTSHEALVLAYEIPQVRQGDDGRYYLTSTHWPWIGERTRDVDGAHVNLLAALANPVACKIGPSTAPSEILALAERLDPHREPGRLTFIARLGATAVGTRLPRLVAAVRAAGHPVIWLCDPMHANTVSAADGRKTRMLSTILREVDEFQAAVASGGGLAGGLHLETTPYRVDECVADETELAASAERYTTQCDPRLNPEQALAVAGAWR